MNELITKLNDYIWGADLNREALPKRLLLSLSRFFYLIITDLANGQLNLRAMSLVFTTILSFVPVIAVSFSVLKAFGVHNQIEPALLNLFAPLGEKGPELTSNVIGFVDNVKVGLLGTLGIAFLFYSVLSLMKKVEEAFNYTWRIKRTRSLAERFGNYLSVLMVGPVLVIAALGTTASLLNNSVTQGIAAIEPFGTLLEIITRLVPYLLIIAAFTFAYAFIPNTKVRFMPALIGGLVAGILWQSVGWIYAIFVANSTTQNAIYAGSAFAVIFFFMTWLYLSWLILLVGSSVAFYRQYPEYLMAKTRSLVLNNYDREYIALNVLLYIGKQFYAKQPPVEIEELVDHLVCPRQPIEEALQCFETASVLRKVENSKEAYLPAVPLENLLVSDVYKIVRCNCDVNAQVALCNKDKNLISNVLSKIEQSMQNELGDLTIKQLVFELEEQDDESHQQMADMKILKEIS